MHVGTPLLTLPEMNEDADDDEDLTLPPLPSPAENEMKILLEMSVSPTNSVASMPPQQIQSLQQRPPSPSASSVSTMGKRRKVLVRSKKRHQEDE